jgi:protein-disulfide isomerase
MNRIRTVGYLALLCGTAIAGGEFRQWSLSRCTPPRDVDRARLINFVRANYGIPPGAKIGMADTGVIAGSCFRKLVFSTLSGAAFHAEVYTSPDFRFVTSEFLDARPDPAEAAKRRRETAESLMRGTEPVRGISHAPVTLAIFSDFQCPYCAQMARTVDELAAREGDRLRVVYHYYPLSFHAWARPAAEAAACAQRESARAFWSLHDFLFAHQRELSAKSLHPEVAEWARAASGVNQERFARCIDKSLTSGQIEQDIALANELGVQATPTVFVNGESAEASTPDELRALIERAAKSPIHSN